MENSEPYWKARVTNLLNQNTKLRDKKKEYKELYHQKKAEVERLQKMLDDEGIDYEPDHEFSPAKTTEMRPSNEFGHDVNFY